MDFNVAAPGGVPAGNAAALAARGADPAIDIPAAHFFRRVSGLTLSPIPGALVAVPTTLPQSIVELVCNPLVTHGDQPNVCDRPSLFVKVLPSKLDQALTQLELEPAGVGLTPGRRVVFCHTEGTRNVMSDAWSRGYIETARLLCAQLGMAFERRAHGPIVSLRRGCPRRGYSRAWVIHRI